MKKITQLLKWILKAWPILGIAAFFFIHKFFLMILSYFTYEVNSIFSSLSQFLGGLIIIIIIGKNISEFRHMNLLSYVKEYFKSFPLLKHHHKITGKASFPASSSLDAYAFTEGKWETVEQGIQELEKRIRNLRTEMNNKYDNINKRFTEIKDELNASINMNTREIHEVQKSLERTVLDDLKIQFFGILLVVYGFIVDLLIIFPLQ